MVSGLPCKEGCHGLEQEVQVTAVYRMVAMTTPHVHNPIVLF